jgi:hypothetical protein
MNLLSLNTKPIGIAGLISGLVGLLCYGPFQQALSKAWPAGATWLGLAFIVAGFAATYYGMPATVPTAPAQPVPVPPTT